MTAVDMSFDSATFRNVLGHFPTGVAAVTAIGVDGEPVGMAVGSFTSVSLDPPLVAFLPDKSSTSFPKIRKATRFCVNFLTAEQEWICRVFATRGAKKFQDVEWTPAPVTGSPKLAGVVAWLDCEIETIHEAGDHFIVIGRVLDLSADGDVLPLLFFQGGFGRFASLTLSSFHDTQLLRELRFVEVARPEMERLASDLHVECLALVRQGDQMLTLAASGDPQDQRLPSRVGQRQPLVPPMGALLVAWEGAQTEEEWLDLAPPGGDYREALSASLDRVRARGWSLGLASPQQRAFAAAVGRVGPDGPTPDQARELLEASRSVVAGHSEPELLLPGELHQVRSISAPVFDTSGNVPMMLTLFGFREMTTEQIFAQRDELLASAALVSNGVSGRRP